MPTLGRTTLGDTNQTGDSGVNAIWVGQMPVNGTVTDMALGALGFFGATTALLSLWTGDAVSPIGSALATGTISHADGVNSFQSVSGLNVPLTAGANVYLSILDGGVGGTSFSKVSATSGYHYAQRNATYPTLPSPFGTPDYWDDRVQYAAYITYSTGAAAAMGGIVARQRPIGRGPHMRRNRAVFKRSQGSQATRQVLLQLFSSPGVVLANTSVTFYTAYDDKSAAIDGPLIRTTDASGYVLLTGLNIPAVAATIRYQITGDPTKHRVSAVTFVN